MAISDRIKAEARRTIDGMQQFYSKYSDDVDDAEELEHRIARVEASMEGCNGLTQDEKIQKTAENVFELTCAQERSYDALRMEMKRSRDASKKDIEDMRNDLKHEIKKGLDGVMKKIEDSGMDCSLRKPGTGNMIRRFIIDHPMLSFYGFVFFLSLVFVSGHLELLAKLFGVATQAK